VKTAAQPFRFFTAPSLVRIPAMRPARRNGFLLFQDRERWARTAERKGK